MRLDISQLPPNVREKVLAQIGQKEKTEPIKDDLNKAETVKRSKNSIKGSINREEGLMFEQLIENACMYYRSVKIADIEKTPEPMRIIGKRNENGKFMCCFTKRAQPDFKGVLRGGRCIAFEAKSTVSDKIMKSVVSSEQSDRLESYTALGAVTFVLISIGCERFAIPWAVWSDMRGKYGREYLRPADIKEYAVPMKDGLFDILGSKAVTDNIG